MKQNYPTSDQIKSSGDRVAALLRRAAQPVEPDFGSQYRGIMNAGVARVRGERPLDTYNATIEGDEKKKRQASMDALKAEAGVYDLLLEQKKQGNADAEEILNVASKLSGNDAAQMSRLINEAYNRYPDGDITLTDAVNLAGELGIKPVKTDEQKLREELYRAQISRAERPSGGDGGLTEYQRQRLELQRQNYNYQKTKEDKKTKQLMVPGYEISADIEPTLQDAGEIRTMAAARDTISRTTQELSELVGKYGRNIAIDPRLRTEIQQKKQRIALNAKELERLGALAGPDKDILDQLLPDPLSRSGLYNGPEVVQKQFKDYINYINGRVDDNAAQRGYIRGGQPSSEPSARAAPSNPNSTIEDTLAADASIAEKAAALPAELPEEQVSTGKSVASANNLTNIKSKYGLQ